MVIVTYEQAPAQQKAQQQPQKSGRSRILPTRVQGTVVNGNPTSYWLKPNTPIKHADAGKHGGNLYLAVSDVELGAKLHKGQAVDFFVYRDAKGLGAEHCRPRPAGAASTQQMPLKAVPKASAGASNQMKGVMKTIGKPGREVLQPTAKVAAKPGNQSAFAKKNLQGAQKPAAASVAASHPDRKVVNLGVPVNVGTITDWKGKFGWIAPIKPVSHPLASKTDGKLYVGAADVVQGEAKSGVRVSFTIYSDSKGLGAQNCKVIGQGGAKPGQTVTKPGQAPFKNVQAKPGHVAFKPKVGQAFAKPGQTGAKPGQANKGQGNDKMVKNKFGKKNKKFNAGQNFGSWMWMPNAAAQHGGGQKSHFAKKFAKKKKGGK